MIPPGLGFPDGDFGEYARRVCAQWRRNPALASRMVGVRYALRNRIAGELLAHIWSDQMAEVLDEIEWCVEFADSGKSRGQMMLFCLETKITAGVAGLCAA